MVAANTQRQIWSDLVVRWRGILIISIPVSCLLTSLMAFGLQQSNTDKAQKYVDNTEQVLLESDRLLKGLLDAETAVRGYDLTRRQEFLEPYNSANVTLRQNLSNLNQLVAKESVHHQQLQQIEALTQKKISVMRRNLALVNSQKVTANPSPQLIQLVNQGKYTMDALRTAIDVLQQEERHLLEQQKRKLENDQDITTAVLWSSGIIGFIGAIAALVLFDRLNWELAIQANRLRESNTQLQAILDNVVDGIITIDEDGHIQSFNHAAQLIFGYEPAEVLGKNLKRLIREPIPSDSMEVLRYFVGNNKLKLRRQQQSLGRHKNGNEFPLELALSEMQLADQRLFIGIVRDITQRQQAEETLRKQAQLLDLANDAILVRDENDQITYWNQGAERLYGWTKAEALGQFTNQLLKTQSPQPIEEIQEIVLEEGYWKGELVNTKRDGTQIYVASRWTLQVDEEGEPLATLEINNDITERKLAEAALHTRASELARLTSILAQTNAALEKRNHELDQFAYIVSHDLKAPLRAIANLATWLEEDLQEYLSGDTQYQMELLRGRVHRMEALIEGILNYSRVGRLKAALEWVDVHALLMDIIDSIAPPPGFTVIIGSGMPQLRTERLPLEQVFTNLISNAIKHHDRLEGQVNLSVQDQGDAYLFSVADNGPGIAPEFHERVFVIFETLKARDKVENTGVGLAIVKKIVEDKGGIIRLESQIGQGTTFYFTWPKQLENASELN